jgi:hypothetical protein
MYAMGALVGCMLLSSHRGINFRPFGWLGQTAFLQEPDSRARPCRNTRNDSSSGTCPFSRLLTYSGLGSLSLILLHTLSPQINTNIIRIEISCTWKRCVLMTGIYSHNRFRVSSVLNRQFRVWNFERFFPNLSHMLNRLKFLWGVGSPHNSAWLSCWEVFVLVDIDG